MTLRLQRLSFRASYVMAVWTAASLLSLGQSGCRRGNSPNSAGESFGKRKELSFNETIQPLLSENCYACHGPDPGARKAGLRLDRPEFATAAHGTFGPAIVRGDPDKSPLILRIESQDEKKRMPPVEAHKTLKPEEIALLRQWVKKGAEYQEHWAFIVPKRPDLPAVRHTGWAKTDIDRFILARLEREHLEPSPEADRRVLIRRVTYDLTGLPPTPEEVEAFVGDRSPEAYEKVVDRLLASPRYGEHRAHYWLDLARYGDTHGLHNDSYRSIWHYRDYVIRAFNDNKPFDRFVREQLAGDLLPAKSFDELVATGFVRAGVSTGEGGSLSEELRVNNKRERAETYGTVFLGLTVGCAVCHDHKFDPTTHKDFYRLTAFFNNLTELPFNDDRSDWPPSLALPKPENETASSRILEQRAELEQRIAARRARARELVKEWLSKDDARPRPVSDSGMIVRLRFDEGTGAVVANSAPGVEPKTGTATGNPPIWGEGTWFWPYMRFETSTRLELPAGDFEKDRPFSIGCWLLPHIEALRADELPSGVIVSHADAAQNFRGWSFACSAGKLILTLAHRAPDDAISVETKTPVLATGRWNHIGATYDGSGRAAGVALYVDGQPQELTLVKDALAGPTSSAVPLQFGRQPADANSLRQMALQDFRLYTRALAPEEAARVPIEDYVAEIVRRPMSGWNEDEFKAVSDFYFARHDIPVRVMTAQLPAYNGELERLSRGGGVTLVCQEGPGLAYADVLTRGIYSARTERVRPGVPHFLPPLPSGSSPDRLALAEWTVNPANPLTARVTVNRMWQEVFGTGLVETTEDFGIVGARPSHPELLDWLAVDFRESGWNVKSFYKQLVMSATYRQSARTTPELLEKDPKNRLLARGPRFRMDAEMLRDTALAVSGLLVKKIGDPGVKPYQPPGVWEAVRTIVGTQAVAKPDHWEQDRGEGTYRRSIYTFWKRQAIIPNMETFNAPARDVSCTRRERTNTPLQTLVLWNDPQWMEASRFLALRAAENAGGEFADRLDFLARSVLSRPLSPDEAKLFENSYALFARRYAADPSLAAKLLDVGDTKLSPASIKPEMAALTLVASQLLNTDEALNK